MSKSTTVKKMIEKHKQERIYLTIGISPFAYEVLLELCKEESRGKSNALEQLLITYSKNKPL